LRRVPRDPAVDALWVASAAHGQGEVSLMAQAGLAKLPQPLIDAVRGALQEGPQTIAALRALPGCSNVTPSELIAMLIGSDSAAPLWRRPGSGTDWDRAVAVAQRFNAVMADRLTPFGTGGGQMGLATPALGGGLPALPLELALAMRVARAQSGEAATSVFGEQDAAHFVRALMPGPEASVIEELERKVGKLLRERLPVWRSLGIA
jgi:hypothetical protein